MRDLNHQSNQFKDYFSSNSPDYALHRPNYPTELAHYLAGLAPNPQLAWDCGCGTGQFSEQLARYFAQVIATDASAAQIQQAQAHNHNINIDYQIATAEHSGLAAQSVDLISVAQAAHWFDLPAFYQEVKQVARPQAILALITYGMVHVESAALEQLVQHFYHQVVGQYWPAERQHIVEGYANLYFPFQSLNVPDFNMRVNWNFYQLMGYLNTWSAVIQAKQAGQAGVIVNFFADLKKAWGNPEQYNTIHWDLTVKAARLNSIGQRSYQPDAG